MIATKNRTTLFPSAYSFPPIPLNTTTFIDSGLTTRPTFFGCDSATSAPLIIYIANGGPPRNTAGHSWTNSTSDQLEYRHTLQLILNQVTAIAIQGENSGSSKVDPEWPACLACAVVDRARNRSGVAREGVCGSCFQRYCWSESGGKA
jgi:lysophospholipase